MIANYNDRRRRERATSGPWRTSAGSAISTYPTTYGIFNTSGTCNIGGYSDPKADELITASITSSNPTAVTEEAAYLTTQQPGLFQPNVDSAFTSAIASGRRTSPAPRSRSSP